MLTETRIETSARLAQNAGRARRLRDTGRVMVVSSRDVHGVRAAAERLAEERT
jgi:hypothetical protein